MIFFWAKENLGNVVIGQGSLERTQKPGKKPGMESIGYSSLQKMFSFFSSNKEYTYRKV